MKFHFITVVFGKKLILVQTRVRFRPNTMMITETKCVHVVKCSLAML